MTFFNKVRNTYLGIAAAEPERVKVVNAADSLDGVQRQIEAVLKAFFSTTLKES